MPVLQFKGKTAIETYHHTVAHHALEFDEKLSVLTKGERPSLDGNLIIEGDNLLALKALLPTHAGKIKCIYIDPPYNTGNEGWVYNDNLTQPLFKEWIGQTVGKEAEDATRHDKWCCMMYPRLQLLKELLREDGAIFISIDDNEVANLRALMDEIFGGNNFIASVIWEKVYSPKSTAKFFSDNHDFIIVYAKSKANWELALLPRTEEANARYDNIDKDRRGPWKPSDLSARNPYSKGTYSITCPGGRIIPGPPPGNYWRVSEDKLWKLNGDNRIWWGEDENQVPAIKRFLSEVKQGLVPETIWTYKEVGHTQDAKQTLLEIFGKDYTSFLTPKLVALIERIIQLSTEENDIVLDSFAGSGTTAQSVLSQNKVDGGDRKFILIQQPYDTKSNEVEAFNICKNITGERVRRVVSGYNFEGSTAQVLMEKKLDIATLKHSGDLWHKIEKLREPNFRKFDEIKTECSDGFVRVLGMKSIKGKKTGTGDSFSYVRLSKKPILGEYRDITKNPPLYDEIAKYVFYTETSTAWDKSKSSTKTGKIGEHRKTSFYLLYTLNATDDQTLDLSFLNNVIAKDKNPTAVVYCEKIWIHRSDLLDWSAKHKKSIRPMIVPFNLK